MIVDESVTPAGLAPAIRRFWERSARTLDSLNREYDSSKGSPVVTVKGRYTARGWTEWTQGFQYGSEILHYDATGEDRFLDSGRRNTVAHMAPHVTHFGVHDHGFNNVSTYGNLRRLMNEGRIEERPWERAFYEMALKASGAVQAKRWTKLPDGGGFIYSFNGPHSLFADTIRSLRSLALAHRLGHGLMDEHDERVSLLHRLVRHAETTSRFNVYFGTGRDAFDVRGRTAHESIFNLNDGRYRCPSTQQGYSPFSTWTRGLAWIALGYPEQLEFLETVDDRELEDAGGRDAVETMMRNTAMAVCDFYIDHTCADGIPYWDTGAPGLARLSDPYGGRSDPYTAVEPVDSSAAAIAAQGLLRLGTLLSRRSDGRGSTYTQAGLTVLQTLLDDPYLSADDAHQGLLLHSVYHRPNGWDRVPDGRSVPCGESSMWGDYHLREAVLLAQRLAENRPYYVFFR